MSFFAFLLLVIAAGSSGTIFKPDRWYEDLRKPGWTPPNWAFPVVWTILYLLIAAAGWLVWKAGGWSLAIAFWGAQWLFNSAWSWLFFGRRRMDWALADISLLWLATAGFMVAAWPLSPAASLMFLPYLIWVTTAALLNRAVWRLNPEQARGEARSS